MANIYYMIFFFLQYYYLRRCSVYLKIFIRIPNKFVYSFWTIFKSLHQKLDKLNFNLYFYFFNFFITCFSKPICIRLNAIWDFFCLNGMKKTSKIKRGIKFNLIKSWNKYCCKHQQLNFCLNETNLEEGWLLLLLRCLWPPLFGKIKALLFSILCKLAWLFCYSFLRFIFS